MLRNTQVGTLSHFHDLHVLERTAKERQAHFHPICSAATGECDIVDTAPVASSASQLESLMAACSFLQTYCRSWHRAAHQRLPSYFRPM